MHKTWCATNTCSSATVALTPQGKQMYARAERAASAASSAGGSSPTPRQGSCGDARAVCVTYPRSAHFVCADGLGSRGCREGVCACFVPRLAIRWVEQVTGFAAPVVYLYLILKNAW